MDKTQLRELIQDVLKFLEPEIPYSDPAKELLMMTAATESQLGEYIRQIKGPALGIFQMEPETENDIWERWLFNRMPLVNKIYSLRGIFVNQELNPLKTNLAYQVAMARVHYYRAPFRMIHSVNIQWMAAIWKRYYNTIKGNGTEGKATRDYMTYC